MRRFVFLAATIFTLSATAATPPTKVLTHPTPPSSDALDRLNLAMGWRLQLPAESVRDGIGCIQQFGRQLYVQLRDGTIFAIDAETGKVQWSRRVGNRYPTIRRLGNHEELVLALDCNNIIALEKATGVQRWDLALPEVPVAPPMAGELLMYAPLRDGRLLTFALPETVEKVLAKDVKGKTKLVETVAKVRAKLNLVAPVSVTGADPRSVGGSNMGRTASPTDFTRRTTTSSGMTRRLDNPTKQFTAEELQAFAARPTYLSSRSPGFSVDHSVLISSIGLLISGSSDNVLLLRRDLENPVLQFKATAPLAVPPVQFGRVAYLPCIDGTIQALDLITGTIVWQATVPSLPRDPVIVTNRSMFVMTDQNGLVMIDRRSGAWQWTQGEAVKFLSAGRDFVYGTDRLGQLVILDRTSGAVVSRFDLSDYNVSFVNGSNDRIILAANDGSIICLHDQALKTPLSHAAPAAPTTKAAEKAIEGK